MKLNILFISSWFPSKNKPTLGNFVESHARAVSLLHNVDLIYVARILDLNTKFEIERRSEGDLDISIMYYRGATTGLSFLNKIIDAVRHYSAYKTLYKQLEQKPDLVHANIVWPIGIFALYLKFKCNLRFVMTEHWTIYQKENRHQITGFKRWIFKNVIHQASMVTPVSHQLGDAILETGMNGRFTIVPNAINIDLFKFREKENAEDFHFLHISTLVDEAKNVSGILKSFYQLLLIDSANHLTIVSDGDIEPFLENVNRLGIPKDKITFVGTQSATEIVEWFHKSHAFVLFSNYENLPVVILEAFAMGTPVISTDVGGIRERFPEGAGYLIKSKDENALLLRMQDIKQNYSNFNQKTLVDYAVNTFSYKAVAKEYSSVYENVLVN